MVELVNFTRQSLPDLPLETLARRILGTSYDVSIVVCGKDRIRTLNRQFRGMDKPTDVLSFPLSDTDGEVFICPAKVDRKMKGYEFNATKREAYAFILIHAFLHLAGHDHGSTMENEESAHMRAFMRLNDSTNNSSGNRHRNQLRKGGGRASARRIR
jgi:rRNA maturation RNase YbeY